MAKKKVDNVHQFVARCDKFSLLYLVLTEGKKDETVDVYRDGKVEHTYTRFVPLQKKNPRGDQLFSSDGFPLYITRKIDFAIIPRTKLSQHGTYTEGALCNYKLIFEDTDTELQRAQKEEMLRCLNRSSAQEYCSCNTFDVHNKTVNPLAYEERKKREEMETQIETLKDEREMDKLTISDLEQKVKKVLGK